MTKSQDVEIAALKRRLHELTVTAAHQEEELVRIRALLRRLHGLFDLDSRQLDPAVDDATTYLYRERTYYVSDHRA